MGPRSGDRGNLRIHQSRIRLTSSLQWGRDLVIAEILGSSRSSWNTNQLQWGRDLVIAEINKYADVLTLPNLASMGPRSGDRGNERSSTEHAVCRLLQWGRDLVIAEIYRSASIATSSGTASMGPRSGDRGNPDEFEARQRQLGGFNGAAIW